MTQIERKIQKNEYFNHLCENYSEGDTNDIAKKFGKSSTIVRMDAVRFGLKKKNHYWTPPQDAYILKHYNVDMSIDEIAKVIGKSRYATICRNQTLKRQKAKMKIKKQKEKYSIFFVNGEMKIEKILATV